MIERCDNAHFLAWSLWWNKTGIRPNYSYDSTTTWILMKPLKKKLGEDYTRMLCAILNKSWKKHSTNLRLYGHLPLILQSIQDMPFTAGKVKLNWWAIFSYGLLNMDTPVLVNDTFISSTNTGYRLEDLTSVMADRGKWQEKVKGIYAFSMSWWCLFIVS